MAKLFRNAMTVSMVVIGVGMFFFTAYSQGGHDEGFKTKPMYSEQKGLMSKEACTRSFDVKKVDWSVPKNSINKELLATYYLIRAVLTDNVAECSNLNPSMPFVNTCQEYFYTYHAVFGRVLMKRAVTDSFINDCVTYGGSGTTPEKCRYFGEALLTKNPYICDKDPRTKAQIVKDQNSPQVLTCKAMVLGDQSYCMTKECSNLATYANALRSRDPSICNTIFDPMIKSLCKAAASNDIRMSEQDPGYIRLRDTYCSQQ
ncbi:MAG TPA: hypothetical protein PKL77_09805 [Candidatus Omnitrophota bacterium]|nr:hypothetical protein [Candidatus Omnitrophota bacterium]